MSFVNKANNLKKEAGKILQESNLIEILKRFGSPVFTGSYQYNLMTSADIDIYLVVDSPSKIVVKQPIDFFIDQGYWNRIKYADFLNFPHPREGDILNSSFYIGLKRDIGDKEWKVDIWVITKDQESKLDFSWMKDISEQQREKILEMKANKEILGLTSFEIYKNVLKEK